VRALFREYDKDKSGVVREDMKKIMHRLLNDECHLGKIPNISPESVESTVEQWPTTNIGKIPFVQFKERLNRDWDWRMTDRERLDEVVETLFK